MLDPTSPVARNLRRLRLERGLSIAHLAGAAGLTPEQLSQAERNEAVLDKAAISRVAQVLEVDAEDVSGDLRAITAEVIATAVQQRETSRQLRSTLDDLLATTRELFAQIEETRRKHRRKGPHG